MAKGIKIATIGGGSSYTPELMEGFIKRYEELPIREIWLVDVEEGKEKLEIVSQMSQRMWDASPYEVKIYATLDREEALKDADFVTTQFRVGQLDARTKTSGSLVLRDDRTRNKVLAGYSKLFVPFQSFWQSLRT